MTLSADTQCKSSFYKNKDYGSRFLPEQDTIPTLIQQQWSNDPSPNILLSDNKQDVLVKYCRFDSYVNQKMFINKLNKNLKIKQQ